MRDYIIVTESFWSISNAQIQFMVFCPHNFWPLEKSVWAQGNKFQTMQIYQYHRMNSKHWAVSTNSLLLPHCIIWTKFSFQKKTWKKSNQNIVGNYALYFALISCKNELERVITITVSTMFIIKQKIIIIITLTWYFNYDGWIITPWTELMHL